MKRRLEIIGVVVGLFALIAQFVLMIQNRQAGIAETIIRFFSFFTILTNILVVLFFARKIYNKQKAFKIFNHNGALTAITAFILIVGIVYQLVLRSTWNPKGLQLIVDELLHSVIPVFVLIYWIIFSEQKNYKISSVFIWLLYPIVYIIFILIRGSISDFYPYPFFNVSIIGIGNALFNIFLILSLAILIILVLTFLGNKIKRREFSS